MEVARRRGRRRKKLLDDLNDRRGYSHLKEEALDRTMWRHRFGGGFGPVVRHNTEWMNEWMNGAITTVPHTLLWYQQEQILLYRFQKVCFWYWNRKLHRSFTDARVFVCIKIWLTLIKIQLCYIIHTFPVFLLFLSHFFPQYYRIRFLPCLLSLFSYYILI